MPGLSIKKALAQQAKSNFSYQTSGPGNMHSPIQLFKAIWLDARKSGSSKHRNAVCVSTIDPDGYPSSRFVDLKEAEEAGFVFCTHLDSGKALDIARNPKTGITLWWEHIATQ